MRGVLLLLAIILGVAALAFGGYHHYRDRLQLRVAAGAEGGDIWKFLGSAQRILGDDSTRASFRRVASPSDDLSGKMLDEGKVELAVVRSDMPQPASSATLAILRRDYAFLITPAKSNIDSIKDLQGKSVGLLPGPRQDDEALDKLLAWFAVPHASVTRVKLTAAEAGNAMRQKRVAAIFVIGQPLVGPAAEAFASVAKATRATPDIVGIDGAEAFVSSHPVFDTADIPQGAFGGAKPQPEEATPTLAVTWRLVARRSLPNFAASLIARRLIEGKSRLVPLLPLAAQIEAPETSRDQTFFVHPGAAAYYDNEETSFFDRFESLFWLGGALLSLFASVGAWIWRKFRSSEASDWSETAEKLVALVQSAREADADGLSKLEAELEDHVVEAIRARAAGDIEAEDAPLVALALDQARRSLDARRKSLPAEEEEARA